MTRRLEVSLTKNLESSAHELHDQDEENENPIRSKFRFRSRASLAQPNPTHPTLRWDEGRNWNVLAGRGQIRDERNG